jgi:hypothetical protein
VDYKRAAAFSANPRSPWPVICTGSNEGAVEWAMAWSPPLHAVAPAARTAADVDEAMPLRRTVANTCLGSGMTKMAAVAYGVSIALFACVSVLPGNALAQASNAAARPPANDAGAGKAAKAGGAAGAGAGNLDMRLWSFGDCSKNFPYVATPEHKECVRVVGSDEAKDARAIHFCNVGHGKDPAEATRCKEAYFANKTAAEQEGFRTRVSNQSPAAGSAAPAPAPQRDKDAEIAALTRALKVLDTEEPAAAPEPAPEAAAASAPPPSSVSASNMMLGFAILLLLALVGMRHLRNVTVAEAATKAPPPKGGHPKTVTGMPSNQY